MEWLRFVGVDVGAVVSDRIIFTQLMRFEADVVPLRQIPQHLQLRRRSRILGVFALHMMIGVCHCLILGTIRGRYVIPSSSWVTSRMSV
jgi:hypothetical protein